MQDMHTKERLGKHGQRLAEGLGALGGGQQERRGGGGRVALRGEDITRRERQRGVLLGRLQLAFDESGVTLIYEVVYIQGNLFHTALR